MTQREECSCEDMHDAYADDGSVHFLPDGAHPTARDGIYMNKRDNTPGQRMRFCPFCGLSVEYAEPKNITA